VPVSLPCKKVEAISGQHHLARAAPNRTKPCPDKEATREATKGRQQAKDKEHRHRLLLARLQEMKPKSAVKSLKAVGGSLSRSWRMTVSRSDRRVSPSTT
jgi:hypothetical protein